MSIESVMPSNHLILCRPLLLLPPIPPSIRVFSNESTLRMRWPKYWRFSFSIIPSKEIPGLISFRMDWLELLAVQGTLKSLAAAKSLQWCPTLCDPIDGSPPGSPFPGILQARVLEWGAIAFSNDNLREHNKKRIHHFDYQGPKSQSFSSSHVKYESWTIKKAEHRSVGRVSHYCSSVRSRHASHYRW